MSTVTPAREVELLDKPETVQNDLIGFRDFLRTEAVIAQLNERYMALKVNGVDDKEGHELVHAARMEVRDLRVSIEKRRVELKEPALNFGRVLDAEAKRLTSLLTPVEQHLMAQEQIVENEKKRLKAEKEAKIQAELDRRVKLLAECGVSKPLNELRLMEPDYFERILKVEQEAKAERDRIAAEEAERKRLAEEAEAKAREEERQRIERERAELAAERKRQEEAQAELDRQRREDEARRQAELDAIEAKRREEQAELDRQRHEQEEKQRIAREQLEREQRELAEQKAAIERQQREEAERKAAEEKRIADEKAAAERAERLKPIKQQVNDVANKVIALIELLPEYDDAGERDVAVMILERAAHELRMTVK